FSPPGLTFVTGTLLSTTALTVVGSVAESMITFPLHRAATVLPSTWPQLAPCTLFRLDTSRLPSPIVPVFSGLENRLLPFLSKNPRTVAEGSTENGKLGSVRTRL